MHRFTSVFAARPLIGFSGRSAGAVAPGGQEVVARRRRAVLVGLALLAVALALVLWLAPPRGAESTEGFLTSAAERASTSQPAWLAPLSAPLALAGGAAEPPTASEQAARDAYARLPLSFVENAGQIDEQVRYYAQGQGFGFYFTPERAVLSFTEGRRGAALHLKPLGASPKARLVAGDPAPGRVNYLRGAERHTGLPTFHELSYRELWPGIDLVFRGQGGRLKYEFRLAPGADPSQIRLAYRGANGLSLSRGGALRIGTPLGTLRDSRPRSYQRIGGERVAVESRYVLDETGYGFALGPGYDPARALVIDPALVYSTFLGGGEVDLGFDVEADTGGSAYVTGHTRSASFPTTAGAYDTAIGGDRFDAFVTKLSPSGSALSYSTYLGGGADDGGFGLEVDGEGSVYLTGTTLSADFPTTAGAYDTTFNGNTFGPFCDCDAFVTKLSPSGSGLIYSTFLGGDKEDQGSDIVVDTAGRAYVTGQTGLSPEEISAAAGSSDFPVTPGAFDTTPSGGIDTFVTKLDPSGSSLSYSTYLEGNRATGMALDADGSAYVTGSAGSGLPTTPGAYDTSFNGFFDAFVTKLNPVGSALSYSTFLGGDSIDRSADIALDGAGSAYITGDTFSINFPTTAGASDTTPNGGYDVFATKLNSAGTSLDFSTYLGGAEYDFGSGIIMGRGGGAYITGNTASSDFPTTTGADDTTFNGGAEDAFVTRLSSTGAALSYSTYLGGGGRDLGDGIARTRDGSVFVTGGTNSTNYPTTAGAHDTVFNGGEFDAFVTKLNLNQCSDGRDNDGDSRIDFPADPGCSSASDDDERDPERVLFGKTTVGSAFSSLDHNDKYGSRYYLLTQDPVTVVRLRAYLDGLGESEGSQVLRGLIYRHTSTGPGALVARTFQGSLKAGLRPGWVDLYFPYPPRLFAGGYWLTIHAGESEQVVRYAFDPKPGAQRYNDDLFSNGPLNPFGGSDTAAKEMSIHAVGR